MPGGCILNFGQAHITAILFKNTAVQNYYLALITNTVNPALDKQIGDGITEVSGTGYGRILLTRNTDWTQVAAKATAVFKEYTAGSGGWADVNGYAVCLSATPNTADAIFAEAFDPLDQGTKPAGRKVQIICEYEQQDTSE